MAIAEKHGPPGRRGRRPRGQCLLQAAAPWAPSATSAATASTKRRTTSAARAAPFASMTRRCSSRAEIIRDKGTNRQQFFRGLVDKYTWVDVGSSYVPSEICSAFLYGQLEMLDDHRRPASGDLPVLSPPLHAPGGGGPARLPHTPADCAQQFPHVLHPLAERADSRRLDGPPQASGIHAVFHYVPLHSSPMGQKFGYSDARPPRNQRLSGRLLRLPFYYEIDQDSQTRVVTAVASFLRRARKSRRRRLRLLLARDARARRILGERLMFRVLVFPSCNEPGLEIIHALAKSNKITLFGGSSIDPQYDPSRQIVENYLTLPWHHDEQFDYKVRSALRTTASTSCSQQSTDLFRVSRAGTVVARGLSRRIRPPRTSSYPSRDYMRG